MFLHGDYVLCSGHDVCCPSIQVTGLARKALEGTYTFNGTVLNDRQLYVQAGGRYGLWYKDRYGWIIGSLSNISGKSAKYGYVYSSADAICPSSVSVWNAWWNRKWSNKYSIVSCGKGLNCIIQERVAFLYFISI